MLKKLLKYDFQSVFKYWWIAALVSFVLSIGGGICIKLLGSEKILPEAIYIISLIKGVALVLICHPFVYPTPRSVFSISTSILLSSARAGTTCSLNHSASSASNFTSVELLQKTFKLKYSKCSFASVISFRMRSFESPCVQHSRQMP